MQALLFGFQGRFTRASFWFVLVGVSVVETVLLCVAFISHVLSAGADGTATAALGMSGRITGIVVALLFIPLIWIGLAASVKRWHDCNKSGWWMLVNFVPVIGGLWFLIECGFLAGTPGPNAYGPDPLAAV